MEDNNINIEWIKQIAANQRYRSTWEANINGKKCIVKKISAEGKKLDDLTKSLRKQVTFSEILNAEEQKGICLFDTMVENDGNIAFIRRWCDGDSLEQILQTEKKYSMPDAVELMLKIAHIVSQAHSHNVTHGDLKPANIIVSGSKEVTIIDWDTMTIDSSIEEFHDSNRTVSLDQVVGTPQYMPIEQFQGDLDFKCDIYAMGVILYQLLTGETPFDSAGPMTATQMAIYKQSHEPESILVKFPELGISQDLANVIEQSLKTDRNRRFQSVDEFLQKLQNIGKITGPGTQTKNGDGPGPVPPPPPPPSPSPLEGKEHKLVLIGHTGAGKTVLVAGLYASQDKDFSVDDPGARTETGIHAINMRSIIEDGHWPAATSIGDITDLKFKINYKGRKESIAFPEYAGERLNMEGFDKLILGKPDGAFILLNPGSELLQKTHDRLELLSKIKEYITKLGEMAKKTPVALVITASDRLDNDLADFAPKFEKYVEELTNSLETHIGSENYKRFNVSVSGHLENQNKPKLEPKGIKEPFIWLIEQFDHKAHVATMRKIVKYAACFVTAFTLLALGKYGWESYTVNKLQSSFAQCQKDYNKLESKGTDEMIDYRTKLVELRKSKCSLKHIDLTQRIAPCTSNCQPWFVFSPIRKKYNSTIIELEEAIDQINYDYFSKRLNTALSDASPDNRKVQGELASWMPLQKKNESEHLALSERASQELPLAIVKYDAKDIEKRLNALINNPKETFPSELADACQDWTGDALPETERRQIKTKLEDLEKRARTAVENKHYNTLLAYLNGISANIPADLKEKIESWNNHQTVFSAEERLKKEREIFNAYVTAVKRVIARFSGNTADLGALISLYKSVRNIYDKKIDVMLLNSAQQDMDRQMMSVVNSHVDTLHRKYQSYLINLDEYTVPDYVSSIKNNIFPQLTSSEKSTLEEKMRQLEEQAKVAWNKEQERKIDEFIASIRYLGVKQILNDLKEKQLEGWNKNPFWNKAEDFVLQCIHTELNDQWRKFDFSEKAYLDFKEFCAKVRSAMSKKIQNSAYWRFADAYVSWMNSNPRHTIEIRTIEGSSTYKDGAYIFNCQYKYGNGSSPLHSYITRCDRPFYGSWTTIPGSYSFSVVCKPWEDFWMLFEPWQNIEWDFDNRLSGVVILISPGENMNKLYYKYAYESDYDNKLKYGSSVDVSCGPNITLRLYYTITGKTVADLLTEAGLFK